MPRTALPMALDDRRLFRLTLAGFVLATVAAEAHLIHRTRAYFGGGMMNQPLALEGWPAFAAYFLEAAAYDLAFYATAAVLLSAALRRVSGGRLDPRQRGFLAWMAIGQAFAAIVIVRWQIHLFLKQRFDWGILRRLLASDLGNLLGGLSVRQRTALGVAVFLLADLVVVTLVARRLGRAESGTGPCPGPSRRARLGLAAAWVGLVLHHFAVARHEALRFGLGSKVSFFAVNQVLARASDLDRDGFGPLTAPADPDNRDASVHPYAADLPGNAIDEDGLAGDRKGSDVALAGGGEDGRGAPGLRTLARANGRNVIVVVVETFRPDVVDQVLDRTAVMPFLGRHSREPGFTPYAYSNWGTTSDAIQTIFLGTIRIGPGGEGTRGRTLFDEARRLGYRTLCVSAENETWGDNHIRLGLERLDVFLDARSKTDWDPRAVRPVERMNPVYLSLDSREVNRRVFEAIDQGDGRPFFLYVNYQDLHYPYHEEWMDLVFIDRGRDDLGFFREDNVAAIRRQYANAARYLDRSIEELFAGLEARGLDERTVVVIVGDHPESFYENGLLGHFWTVDDWQRRTPLLVVNGRGRQRAPVGQDEIAGIVLDAIDAGRDLGPLAFELDPAKRVFVFTGSLAEPRQIAWIRPGDLVTYDFRLGRVQLGADSAWLLPSETAGHPRERDFLSLVEKWESEVLALSGPAL